MSDSSKNPTDAVGVRWPELIVAMILAALAVLIIADSLRVGTGWADDGPRSGYFPFYIGWSLLLSSAWIALQQLRRWRVNPQFAERSQLRLVLAVLWPSVVYVALIKWLGIYVASAMLISFFMMRHGKHSVPLTAAVAIGVPLSFLLVFERWFLVPLPKGPLETWLGM